MEQEILIGFDELNNKSFATFIDKEIGECIYEVDGNKWYITHTFVNPDFGGRGIAKQLVLRVVEEANKRDIKVIPICSYAQKVLG